MKIPSRHMEVHSKANQPLMLVIKPAISKILNISLWFISI